jgi:hypothetical protein
MRRSKPHMYEDGAPSTAFRLARGPLDGKPRPRKTSDSYDPGSSRSTPLIHLLIDKAFNATTPTNVATAPPAWEQHPCLNPTFYCPSRDGSEKAATIHTTSSTILSSTTPRRARRQPPHPGFLGLSIIHSSSTPSVTSRPGLERRRSTEE